MTGDYQNNMNDRDLLIILNERMEKVMGKLERGGETIRTLELRVLTLETRINIYVAIASASGGIVGSIISKMLF